MARAGLAIRQDRALAAAGSAPCTECGHPIREHHELPYEDLAVTIDNDGEIHVTTVRNPDYEPLVFHCNHDGCDCKYRVAA